MDNIEYTYVITELQQDDEDTKPIIPIIDIKPEPIHYDTSPVREIEDKMPILTDTYDIKENQEEIHTIITKEEISWSYEELGDNLQEQSMHSSDDLNKFTKSKHFKCDACDEILHTKSAIKAHKSKSHRCKICNKWFSTYRKFTKHTTIHPVGSTVPCDQCDKRFETNGKLNTHLKNAHTMFDCSICKKSLKGKHHFLSHVKKHRIHENEIKANNQYQCDGCKKILPSESTFKAHVKISHRCKLCNKWFSDLEKFKLHTIVHPIGTTVRCKLCDNKQFETLGKLQRHLNYTHRAFDCSVCKKSLKGENNYQRHLKNHVVNRNFKCQMCYENFKCENSYHRHKVMHSGKTFECYFCTKSFASFSSLRYHFIIHSMEKIHRCPICDKTFLRAKYVVRHNRVHTKEKLFQCNICEKYYSTADVRKKHIKYAHP